MEKKLDFEDFISTVDSENADFVRELHQELTNYGCKMEVKEAKSGYVVSYLQNKKAIANYVFRKKGLLIRIYANRINEYMQILDTLPENMVKEIKDASICKRLTVPGTCNSKCAMGYDFLLGGERFLKCRNSAFLFLLSGENNPFIKNFVMEEAGARER